MRLLIPAIDFPPHFSFALQAYKHCSLLCTTAHRRPRRFSIGDRHRHRLLPPDPKRHGISFVDEELFYADLINELGIESVLVGSDHHLRLFERLKQKRAISADLLAPSGETVAVLQSKIRARQFFEATGAPIPAGKYYSACDTISIDCAKLIFPIILKRDISEGTSGVSLVNSKEELEIEIRKSLLLQQDFIIEENLGKTPEISIQFIVKKNKVHPLYGLRKMSHFAPSFSTSFKSLQASEQAFFSNTFASCFEALDDGLYSAQLKLDLTGAPRLIEISCRLGNNVRIVSQMWPQLTSIILLFYKNDNEWRRLIETMATDKEKYGISLVEDILGRIHRIIESQKGRRFEVISSEASTFMSLILKRPYLDDYILSLIRHPSVALFYYRNVLFIFFSDWRTRSKRLRMVER